MTGIFSDHERDFLKRAMTISMGQEDADELIDDLEKECSPPSDEEIARQRKAKQANWEKWLSRHKKDVAERIQSLNPTEGPRPGMRPRGWNPKKTAHYYKNVLCCMTAADYDHQLGRGAHKLVETVKDGKRKYVAFQTAREKGVK